MTNELGPVPGSTESLDAEDELIPDVRTPTREPTLTNRIRIHPYKPCCVYWCGYRQGLVPFFLQCGQVDIFLYNFSVYHLYVCTCMCV